MSSRAARRGAAASFDLGRFLPYLINRAGVRLAVAFSAEIARHKVGLQDWRVLAGVHVAGPSRLGDLSILTSIEMSTLSRLVGRMMRAGLVDRAREDGDRRAVRIELTAKGRQVVGAIVPLAHEYERTALSGFTFREAQSLRRMLARVFRNLDALPQ